MQQIGKFLIKAYKAKKVLFCNLKLPISILYSFFCRQCLFARCVCNAIAMNYSVSHSDNFGKQCFNFISTF